MKEECKHEWEDDDHDGLYNSEVSVRCKKCDEGGEKQQTVVCFILVLSVRLRK
jgi:hypothetical protein